MRYLLFLIAIVSLGFWACGENKQLKSETRAWEGVMAVHDSIMPEMSTINRHKRQLKPILEDSTFLTRHPELESIITQTVRQLSMAENGMMDWMAEVKSPQKLRDSKSHEEIMVYLSTELQKIEIVREDMLDAMDAGAGLLEMIELKKTPEEE